MTLRIPKTRLWYIAFTVLLCLPLVTTAYPPLVDYPNHLARTYILAHFHLFSAYYYRLFQPIPNLAMDLVIPPLLAFLPPLLAGKLYLLGLLLLYAFGCLFLARTIFGYDTRMAYLPLFFFYNSTFLMGFINYVTGIALFLIAFACWLRWRFSWTVLRFLGFTGLVSLCYLAHLSSIAILGLCIGSILLWDLATRQAPWTQALLTGAAAVPSLWAYKLFMHGTGQLGIIRWNTVTGKAIGLLQVIRSYNVYLDAAVLLCLLGAAVMMFLARPKITVNRNALLPALMLFLAFLICPVVLFTSSSADIRFVWPACILLALSFRLPTLVVGWTYHPTWRFPLHALVLLILTVRLLFIWQDWHQENDRIARIVESFYKLPVGAKLYPAFFNTGSYDGVKRMHGYEHLACYAVITRDAFVPTIFALPGQQPIQLKTNAVYHVWTPASFHPERYQYVWTYQPPAELQHWLQHAAVPVVQESQSAIWRILPKLPKAQHIWVK